MRHFSSSQRKIFQLSANGGEEKQNINLVPISQRQRYEYYINHSERERELRAHISWYTTIKVNLNLFKLNLDRGATYLFPILFLTFNICYWTVYLVVIPSYQTDPMMEQEEWSNHIVDRQLLKQCLSLVFMSVPWWRITLIIIAFSL